MEALDLDALARAYTTGDRTPTDVISAIHARVVERENDTIWISLTPPEELLEAARTIEARRRVGESLPLYGVPFGVKDNIDVAGLPTTEIIVTLRTRIS